MSCAGTVVSFGRLSEGWRSRKATVSQSQAKIAGKYSGQLCGVSQCPPLPLVARDTLATAGPTIEVLAATQAFFELTAWMTRQRLLLTHDQHTQDLKCQSPPNFAVKSIVNLVRNFSQPSQPNFSQSQCRTQSSQPHTQPSSLRMTVSTSLYVRTAFNRDAEILTLTGRQDQHSHQGRRCR